MSKPDLETVSARRAEVANELSALDRMRAEMEAEDEELQVAERVLKRLQGLAADEAATPSNDAAA
jgi:hypothetical protein